MRAPVPLETPSPGEASSLRIRDDVPRAAVAPSAWDRVAGAQPCLSHAWLSAREESGCANAYRHHGRRYYPKLVAAVPVTPVTGPRMLAAGAAVRRALLKRAHAELARGYSSLHLLFTDELQSAEAAAAGMTM